LVLADWLNDPTSRNYRIGYCEQFAAAMAVMARTLDIPSRVVWGFTPGDVEEQANGDDIIVVRRRNAHAWVEIWVEQVGWMPFDPTPRSEQTGFTDQPPSLTAAFDPNEFLPEAVTSDPLDQPNVQPGFAGDDPPLLDSDADPLAASGVRWWLIGLLALIPLASSIPLYKRLRRRRRLARVRDGDITAAWDEIVDRLTDLGVAVPPSLTPLELARRTDPALVPLAVSYASSVYGGRTGQARDSDLFGVEWWIDRTYDGPTRAKAALSLRSMFRRD
jgi:Transglutaminase-like superfamily